MAIRNRFEKKPVEGADVLAQWQAEWQAKTRAEIVKELGDTLLTALQSIGYERVLKAPTPKPLPTEVPAKKKRRKRAFVKTGPRPGSSTHAVLQAIKLIPGHRGVDILNAIVLGGRKVNERTLRTALRRLKRDEYIEQRNGAWYPTKKEEEKKTAQ